MAYTDMTAEFDYKDLLTYQNMDKMAANDAYVHIPSGTVMPFFQASAPVGWSKQTSVDDSALRVTSGSGGGTGGTSPVSTGLPFAHTHSMAGHTHTAVHVHAWGYEIASVQFGNGVVSTDVDGAKLGISGAGSVRRRNLSNMTKVGEGGSLASSGAVTSASALTSLVFQYVDVIVCSKV